MAVTEPKLCESCAIDLTGRSRIKTSDHSYRCKKCFDRGKRADARGRTLKYVTLVLVVLVVALVLGVSGAALVTSGTRSSGRRP